MSGEIYHLKWKYFGSSKASILLEGFKETNFCDVTLVSDDQKPIRAHRYVLSAHSPFFKDIFLNNTHPNPLIYLKGVSYEDLFSILQFIYLGKASVNFSNMGRFALAAKDLQIKKLADNIRFGNQSKQRHHEDDDDDDASQETHDNNEDETATEYAGRSISN